VSRGTLLHFKKKKQSKAKQNKAKQKSKKKHTFTRTFVPDGIEGPPADLCFLRVPFLFRGFFLLIGQVDVPAKGDYHIGVRAGRCTHHGRYRSHRGGNCVSQISNDDGPVVVVVAVAVAVIVAIIVATRRC
jgi:hypothetical protein